MTTIEQYDEVIAGCRKTFLQKTIDYGTSWRVYRTISVADQIYIKAKRIRTIQQIQSQKIGDDIQSELQGIINYSIIGLIQLDINNDEPENLDITLLEKLYDEKVFLAKQLMTAKNHDYGEAWRDMSQKALLTFL